AEELELPHLMRAAFGGAALRARRGGRPQACRRRRSERFAPAAARKGLQGMDRRPCGRERRIELTGCRPASRAFGAERTLPAPCFPRPGAIRMPARLFSDGTASESNHPPVD